MPAYFTPANPDPSNDFGLALDAGRLVGTVVGSDGHITVRAWCKRKADNGRWITCAFADAYLVDLSVPGADGEWSDKIATWYPSHSSSKWAGRFFVDRAQTDSRRVKAAEYLLDVAAGRKEGTYVELAKRCLRCGKELTHPDSIVTNFGPDCAKELGIANRSGSDEAPHLPKEKNGELATNVEPKAIVFRDLTDEELDRHIAASPASPRGVELQALAAQERTRRNVERDQRDGTAPREFVPPKPSATPGAVDNTPKPEIDADETIVARLRRGDDPKAVLAALDAR